MNTPTRRLRLTHHRHIRGKQAFGLIGIIIVAIGALLASGGFYLSKQQGQKSNVQVATEVLQQAQDLKNQIETANWQTYRNEEYRFQINYPNGWTVNPITSEGSIFITFSDPNRVIPDIAIILLSVLNNASQKTPNQLLDDSFQKKYIEEKILIDNTEGIKRFIIQTEKLAIDNNLESIKVAFIKNNRAFIITADGTKIIDLFNMMLSTFKFIP